MINVYRNGELIGTVSYNSNLDVWNGSNWQNGGTGRHLGITRLSDGTCVLIDGSDWVGDTDTARVISNKKAFELIMKFNSDLLELDAFKDLKEIGDGLLKEVKLE